MATAAVKARGGAHPIEFDGVVKKYGERTVLDDLTFHVPEGAVVGLLGPNGAGKSTAMRVLLGLQRPFAGEARVLGYTPKDKQFRLALRRVGAIIESPPLYKNLSPLRNLAIRLTAMDISIDDAEVRQIIDRVGLEERADDKVGDFSLGMRPRMGIALALVGDPRVVVLDEPTNGLDPEGSYEVRRLISGLPAQGATVLVCTHRLAEIEATCDYVVLLQKGRLVAQGALQDILAQSSVTGHEIEVGYDEVARAMEVLRPLDLGDLAAEGGLLTTSRALEDPSRITHALASAGVYLRRLNTKVATLEEAFLEITGEPETEGGVAR